MGPGRVPAPGVAGAETVPPLPALDAASVRRATANPMTFEATADGRRTTLVPVARAQHEHYTVYWRPA